MPTVFADIVSAGAISFNDDGNKPVGLWFGASTLCLVGVAPRS